MKVKSIIFFTMFLLFQYNVSAQIFGFPKPINTVLEQKYDQEISGNDFTVSRYRSQLSQDKILEFYQEKFKARGWKKMNLFASESQKNSSNSLIGKVFNYSKGNQILVLNFMPLKIEGFIFYSISVGEVPGISAATEQPFATFKEAEPLSFMPLYPGARQTMYKKSNTSIHASYMVTGGMDEAKYFYISRMPSYGWILAQERIGSDRYDLDDFKSSCKTCPELSPEIEAKMRNLNVSSVLLRFEQGKKKCDINIMEMGNFAGLEGIDFASFGIGDTIIVAVYNEL